jgi:hypothetical protein
MTQQETTMKAEEAFNQAAAGYELFGKQLEPFSAMRQAAATAMGLRFGLVDESDIFTVTVETLKEGMKQKQDLQFYKQMYQDCIIVIWLCMVPKSEVLRALRLTDEAKERAFDWADDNQITITSAKFFEAAAVFLRIMMGVAASTPVPKPEAGDDDEDDDPNE